VLTWRPSPMRMKPGQSGIYVPTRRRSINEDGRMDKSSVYLWVLPMFHASGWTYPWSCTFSFCTQVGSLIAGLAVTHVHQDHHPRRLKSGHLEALPALRSHSLLWGAHSAGRFAYKRPEVISHELFSS
jgi:hypothetical protein